MYIANQTSNNIYVDGTDFAGIAKVTGEIVASILGILVLACSFLIVVGVWIIYIFLNFNSKISEKNKAQGRINMVDLELYRIFKAVADEENITRASEILNISQPAVTKHIKNLEETLEILLFERTNRGLKLTDIGQKIYNEIREPLKILNSIYSKYSTEKTVNIGIHSTMLNKLFSEKIAYFYANNENVKINFINNDTDEMLEKLKNFELDLVVSKKQNGIKGLKFISLGKLQDVIISRINDKKVTIDYLKNNILYLPRSTSMSTLNFFDSIKMSDKEFSNTKHITYNSMIEIIKNSDNVGLVTKEYVKKELENNEIYIANTDFDIMPIEYGIYVNTRNVNRVQDEIIKLLKQV